MTLFDYLVLFIIICSIAISVIRGLLKEILSLVGWIVAFVVANAYGAKLAALIPLDGETVRLIVAFVSLFLGTSILMALLLMLVDNLIKASGLKLADRGLGSLFGLARGCIIVLALMLVCELTDLPKQPFWKQAVLRPMVESLALTIKPHLPGSFGKHIKFVHSS